MAGVAVMAGAAVTAGAAIMAGVAVAAGVVSGVAMAFMGCPHTPTSNRTAIVTFTRTSTRPIVDTDIIDHTEPPIMDITITITRAGTFLIVGITTDLPSAAVIDG
jgi:hypothetical protein